MGRMRKLSIRRAPAYVPFIHYSSQKPMFHMKQSSKILLDCDVTVQLTLVIQTFTKGEN